MNSLTQKRSHGPADGEHPVLFRQLLNPQALRFIVFGEPESNSERGHLSIPYQCVALIVTFRPL
jgi:hypothetical protein